MSYRKPAIFDLSSGKYVSQIWFIPAVNGDGDWMACLSKEDDGSMLLVYRFRYYVDQDFGPESKDRKNAYRAKTNQDELTALAHVNELADCLVKAGYGHEVHRVPLKTNNVNVILNTLRAQEWAHITILPVPDSSPESSP